MVTSWQDGCFNPLPTRRSGDTHWLTWRLSEVTLFQSAPNPKVGRYTAIDAYITLNFGFNPLPTRRSGDTNIDDDGKITVMVVSIRSQPEGREILHIVLCSPCAALCFNPLPTRRSGDTFFRFPMQLRDRVSIRSQPEGREIQPGMA